MNEQGIAGVESITDEVRARYADTARALLRQQGVPSDVAGACCGPTGEAAWGDALYDATQRASLPEAAVLASLGCGNPTAVADLHAGETVLDLGSGGGIDVLLSARRVGPTGKAYGLDMTDEMLALARENQQNAGVENAEFLKGAIESIPLPDASVDVVISNCVINLSADKRRVFAEAFRVLKPGGRFAVSDMVVKGQLPGPVRRSMEAWTGCFAGVLEEDEYGALLAEAGFEEVEVEPTRIYRASDVRGVFEGYKGLLEEIGRQGLRLEDLLTEADGKYRSAFIRAVKPMRR